MLAMISSRVPARLVPAGGLAGDDVADLVAVGVELGVGERVTPARGVTVAAGRRHDEVTTSWQSPDGMWPAQQQEQTPPPSGLRQTRPPQPRCR